MRRRDFGKQTLGSLLTYSLLESVFAADAFSAEIKPVAAAWLGDLHTTSNDLKGGGLSQSEWQSKIEALMGKVDMQELLGFIDFEKLTKDFQFRQKGERSVRPQFPEVQGLPKKLVFGHQMFGMKQGQSVVPHGHNNMATAFLVLKGSFHGRHYDRMEDQKDYLIIKPTIDDQFGPGKYSTISEHKDNIHWFKATSDVGYIFNIHVLNVDPNNRRSGRVYVDPDGQPISGGRLRARRLQHKEAYNLYG